MYGALKSSCETKNGAFSFYCTSKDILTRKYSTLALRIELKKGRSLAENSLSGKVKGNNDSSAIFIR